MAVEEVLAPCAPRGAAAHALAPWIISPFARKLGFDLARPFCPAPASLWDEDDDLHNWELVDSCTGSEILAKPSSNGGLNQEEWPSEDMPPSWNGGSDIHIDSHAIGAPEYLSAQHSLYLQMALLSDAWDIIGEDVQDGSVFSYPNAVTLDIGARGVPSDVVTVPHQVYCQGTNRNTSKVNQKDSGAPGSEPNKTDWQQQQVEGTHATLNNVNGPRLIGVDSLLSGAFATAGDKGWLPVCQGKMETSATSLWEISANSGSVICEAECKNISGLAAAEYLIEQHFLIDNAVLGKQLRSAVSAVSSPEQKIGEPEDHSGYGSPVAGEHGISIAPKKTDPAATAWLIASAAPHHATGNRALLSGFAPDHGDLFVKAGDAGAAPMRVVGRGNVVTDAVVLPDVWYVPGLTVNVVSVSQLAELDYSVAFGHGQCYVRSSEDGVVVGTARVGEDGLFALDFIKVPLGI